MAVFSTNLNRQMYIVKAVDSNLDTLGDVKVGGVTDNYAYIQLLGHGGLVKSDNLDFANIEYIKAVAPAKDKLKVATVTITDNPISGEDYILRVNLRLFYGMSDEDIYQKYGAVHAVSGMTKSDFYRLMAYSLFKNLRRTYSPILAIKVTISGTTTEVAKVAIVSGAYKLYDASGTELSGTITALVLAEKTLESEWALGTKLLTKVHFDVVPTTIYKEGSEVNWGTVAYSTADGLGNGYNIADLEYFCMGERGDQYRNVNWPNSIPVKYFADPTKEYYTINIHYSYKGSCEDIQKSEKDVILAFEKGAAGSTYTLVNSFITAWNGKITQNGKYDSLRLTAFS